MMRVPFYLKYISSFFGSVEKRTIFVSETNQKTKYYDNLLKSNRINKYLQYFKKRPTQQGSESQIKTFKNGYDKGGCSKKR